MWNKIEIFSNFTNLQVTNAPLVQVKLENVLQSLNVRLLKITYGRAFLIMMFVDMMEVHRLFAVHNLCQGFRPVSVLEVIYSIRMSIFK